MVDKKISNNTSLIMFIICFFGAVFFQNIPNDQGLFFPDDEKFVFWIIGLIIPISIGLTFSFYSYLIDIKHLKVFILIISIVAVTCAAISSTVPFHIFELIGISIYILSIVTSGILFLILRKWEFKIAWMFPCFTLFPLFSNAIYYTALFKRLTYEYPSFQAKYYLWPREWYIGTLLFYICYWIMVIIILRNMKTKKMSEIS